MSGCWFNTSRAVAFHSKHNTIAHPQSLVWSSSPAYGKFEFLGISGNTAKGRIVAKVAVYGKDIINTFFDQADLAGKQVHLFATSGGTGIDGSVKEFYPLYETSFF
ncbi:MAG: hypothetical protein IJQ12_04965 [Lachnospiraceae bacterium]|nr:hypothetical protein [Lachnospiraceae bacterium]